jgi:putative spermidine/putrescine transport system permease protein
MAARATGLRHRLAERGVDRVLLLLIPAVVTLVALFLYPMLYGVGLSLQPQSGGGTFGNYAAFFHDSYQSSTIWKTLRLALPPLR